MIFSKSKRKGLLKNVQDGVFIFLGSWEICQQHEYPFFLLTLYLKTDNEQSPGTVGWLFISVKLNSSIIAKLQNSACKYSCEWMSFNLMQLCHFFRTFPSTRLITMRSQHTELRLFWCCPWYVVLKGTLLLSAIFWYVKGLI